MTVFSTFLKVTKKYIGTIIMYTCIFLSVALMVTGFNKQDYIESFKSTRLSVAYFNHSDSVLADKLIKYISDNHDIKTSIPENIDSIRDEIYNRNIDYVLIIPEDFGTEHTVSAYKLPGSFSAEFMDMSIENFIKTYLAYAAMGIDENTAYENTLKTVSMSTEVAIYDNGTKTVYSAEHYYYNYMPYILLMAIVTSLAPALMSFNKQEVEKRTLCSGMTIARRNVSLALGCVLLTLAITLIYFICSFFMYGSAMFTKAGALRMLNSVVYALICLSISFFLSSFIKSVNTVNIFSNAFGLGSAFICGVFVPRQFLSDGVLKAGRFFPAYWYVNNEEAFSNLSAASSFSIIQNYGIQLLFAVTFMVLAIVICSKKKAGN